VTFIPNFHTAWNKIILAGAMYWCAFQDKFFMTNWYRFTNGTMVHFTVHDTTGNRLFQMKNYSHFNYMTQKKSDSVMRIWRAVAIITLAIMYSLLWTCRPQLLLNGNSADRNNVQWMSKWKFLLDPAIHSTGMRRQNM
jgi:hypothetical protein